jgi:Ca-activated chloride channel family protein
MRLLPFRAVLIGSLLLLAGSSFPQITRTADTRIILVSVLSKDGTAARNVSPDVFESTGVRLIGVESLVSTPVSYAFVIDTSNSERFTFQSQLEAAKILLAEIVRPQTDQSQLITFDMSPTLREDFTNSPGPVRDAIDRLKPFGGTALYDALLKTSESMRPSSEPRVAFLFSDGEDNQSKSTREEAIKSLIQSGVRLYAFHYTDSYTPPGFASRAQMVLKSLAESTGGEVFEVGTDRQHKPKMERIVERLRPQLSGWFRATVQVPADVKSNTLYRLDLRSRDKSLRLFCPKAFSVGN